VALARERDADRQRDEDLGAQLDVRHVACRQLGGERLDDPAGDDLAHPRAQLVAHRGADHRKRDRAQAALL